MHQLQAAFRRHALRHLIEVTLQVQRNGLSCADRHEFAGERRSRRVSKLHAHTGAHGAGSEIRDLHHACRARIHLEERAHQLLPVACSRFGEARGDGATRGRRHRNRSRHDVRWIAAVGQPHIGHRALPDGEQLLRVKLYQLLLTGGERNLARRNGYSRIGFEARRHRARLAARQIAHHHARFHRRVVIQFERASNFCRTGGKRRVNERRAESQLLSRRLHNRVRGDRLRRRG